MERLSFNRLAWRLVVATEIFYVACMAYRYLLTGAARTLHDNLFPALLVGFSWTPAGMLLGGVDMLILALIGAGVWTWLHNASVFAGPSVTVSYAKEAQERSGIR